MMRCTRFVYYQWTRGHQTILNGKAPLLGSGYCIQCVEIVSATSADINDAVGYCCAGAVVKYLFTPKRCASRGIKPVKVKVICSYIENPVCNKCARTDPRIFQ